MGVLLIGVECSKIIQKSVGGSYGVIARDSGWRLIIIVCGGVKLSYGLNMESWVCDVFDKL